MEISACAVLCYPNIFNVLLYTCTCYVHTKNILILNKSTTTTTTTTQRQLVAILVQHCSKGGATYHLRYAKKHRRFEMSGSFRVEFRNKYGRIRRAHMSASPRFSQFDVYFFKFISLWHRR